MSWVVEDSLRLTISDSDDLVALFGEWLKEHTEIEALQLDVADDVFYAEFHARHKDALVGALCDLSALLEST